MPNPMYRNGLNSHKISNDAQYNVRISGEQTSTPDVTCYRVQKRKNQMIGLGRQFRRIDIFYFAVLDDDRTRWKFLDKTVVVRSHQKRHALSV